MNKLDEICKEIRLLNAIPNDEEAFDCCIKLYNTIIHEPLLLQHAEDSYYIGFSLVAILELNISDDIDIRQTIASIAYLSLSKCIKNNPFIYAAYKMRLRILINHDDAFNYTINDALFSDVSNMKRFSPSFGYTIRDANHKMRWHDLNKCHDYLNEKIFQDQYNMLKNNYYDNSLLAMAGIETKYNETKAIKAMEEGNSNHEKLFDYLNKKIYIDGDINF